MLAAAALALAVANGVSRNAWGRAAFEAVCAAAVLAGLVSVVLACIQTFQPAWADGDWIARPSTPGRAGGNLRQPNHLSSLLLWSMVAGVWLHDVAAERRGRLNLGIRRFVAVALLSVLVFGTVLTVSRTGMVCIVLLAVWGGLDRSLSRFSRVMLWLTPLIYLLCWLGMSEWAQEVAQGFAGEEQFQKSDLSSSRFAIWSNTLALIQQNPWFGVGWGEFNFAWTLTPFPDRPTAFFDHTHNLPLQLLVELGIPLGMVVLGLLAWCLWKAFRACHLALEAQRSMVRAAFVMVLMMGVHSLLEYPLWYAYFLLPTAFALGICLGHASRAEPTTAEPADTPWLRRGLGAASLALMLGAGLAVWDYLRVAAIFSPDEEVSLSQRIEEGQRSWFFAHHADYAAVTTTAHPSEVMPAFDRATHYLLDTRLMLAWAKAYAEQGDIDRARYLADRLREFRNPDSAAFFAACDAPRDAEAVLPFQCTPATRAFTFRDFKPR